MSLYFTIEGLENRNEKNFTKKFFILSQESAA